MVISTNPDVRAVVSGALKQYPWLRFERGGRHGKLRSELTRDFVPIPLSPSDHRAAKNLQTQLRRLAERGEGLIAAKQKH